MIRLGKRNVITLAPGLKLGESVEGVIIMAVDL